MSRYKGFHVGIELEVESPQLFRDAFFFHRTKFSKWMAIEEGSLRNGGIELVSIPLPFPSKAFTEACRDIALAGKNYSIGVGDRTSMHIHVNVSDLDDEQLKSFLYMSYCMEPLLLMYCAPWRRGTSFAVPSWLSTNQVYEARRVVQGGRHSSHGVKYAAISLNRIADYGTVEFRMFEGTFDPARIGMTVKLLKSIYDYALRYTAEQLSDTKRQQGVLNMAVPTLRSLAEERVPRNELEKMLELGAMSANDMLVEPPSVAEVFRDLQEVLGKVQGPPAPESDTSIAAEQLDWGHLARYLRARDDGTLEVRYSADYPEDNTEESQ